MTRDNAVFIYEQLKLPGVTFDFGNTKVVSATNEKFGPGAARTFNTTSGSIGMLVPVVDAFALAALVVYTERPPNYQEPFFMVPTWRPDCSR